MRKEFITKGIQSVVFLPPFEPTNKIAFANEFVVKTENVFSYDPQIISLPKEAPPEIPRIILKNADQTYQVQFSRNRIAFVIQDVENLNPALDVIYPNYRLNLSRILQAITTTVTLPFNRFGFVLQILYEVPESIHQLFSEKYLKANSFSDAWELQMSVHHILRMDEFSTNRWIRYRTLRKREDLSIDTGLSIEIDINTVADQNLNAGSGVALNFFMAAKSHIEKDLNIFPFFDESVD